MEHDPNLAAAVETPTEPGKRRTRPLVVGAIVLAAVFTAAMIYSIGRESSRAGETAAPQPTRDAQIYDLYGMTLAQAEIYLGTRDGSNAAGTELVVVPIPAAPAIAGLPHDQLTVTAACVAPGKTPAGNALGRLNIAVTPTTNVSGEIESRIRDKSFTTELSDSLGCAWWGGALTVHVG
ncbi:hypothetical protein [Nocardia yamanashiensis]|uniref:hypothetical protein n=1 Tax=Nocardia yamanashiensis TaxID=209247 RepID=UPI00082B3415|nr:hypothetical protein [Nocardia yamanashiensis]